MEWLIRETADSVEYVLTDRAGLTDQQISEMAYKPEAGAYVRRYDRCQLMFQHDFVAVQQNYNRHKPQDLARSFNRLDLERALGWIAGTLNSSRIKWWLTGSGALFARGLDVHPHDIDVMTYKTEIPAIEKTFSSFIIEPFEHVSGWVVKGFGALDYNFRIDVAFEPGPEVDQGGWVDFGPYAQSHLEVIEWRGHQLHVPPLEAQLLSNESRGRTKVVEMIRETMRLGGGSPAVQPRGA